MMLNGCEFLMIGISANTKQAMQGSKSEFGSSLLAVVGCWKVQSKSKRLL